MTTLAILAHDEEAHIGDLIVSYLDVFENILVVNDGSKDSTKFIVENLQTNNSQVTLIDNQKNLGAGKSLEICINKFLEGDDEYLIKVDGDNQFKLEDVIKLKKIIETGNYDFIKCDRFWEKGIEGSIPSIRYFGNAFATVLAKFSSGNWKVNDPLNGLFAYSRKSLKGFKLPKLFYRYGYPFYFVTYMINLSIENNIKIGQLKNTIKYKNEKSSLNPLILFFKLVGYSIKNYYVKIKTKLKYSALQVSAFLDIFSQLFLFLSFYSLYKFFSIRYFSSIGPQGSWFIVFMIFFTFSIILLFFSLQSENEISSKNFIELH